MVENFEPSKFNVTDLDGKEISGMSVKVLVDNEVKEVVINHIARFNEQLSWAQVTGTRHQQEDRITAGKIPEDYFPLSQERRHKVLHQTCITLQNKLSSFNKKNVEYNRGTCFLVALCDGNAIDIAYLGDSEAYLIIEGKDETTCRLLNPFHHHPSEPTETAAILRAGGIVKNGRLQGELAVSRAFGNTRFGKILRQDPTCITEPLTLTSTKTTRLIVATDGLTAKKTMPANNYVKSLLANTDKLPGNLQLGKILQRAVADGSIDDITIADLHLSKGMAPTYVVVDDGHGGTEVADLVTKHFYEVFKAELTKELCPESNSQVDQLESTQPVPEETPEIKNSQEDPPEVRESKPGRTLAAAKRNFSFFVSMNKNDNEAPKESDNKASKKEEENIKRVTTITTPNGPV